MIPLSIGLLLLPGVPPQLPADTVHPVLAPPPLCLHAGEGVPAGRDGHVVARVELKTLTAVERGPRARPRAVGHADAQDDGVGEDNGPEGEGMRADGGHEHHWVFGVAEGASGCEIVGCGACGCGHADAVGEDGGKVFVVAEDLRV